MKRSFFLLLLTGAVHLCHSQATEVPITLIDATSWVANGSPFTITGSVSFYEGALLSLQECHKQPFRVENFPELWPEKNGKRLETGTYLIRVLLPTTHDSTLAVSIPEVYNSYQLYAYGKLIAQNGITGKTKQETKPQWLPQTVSFKVENDTLSLVLQIANFYHAKSGIKKPIFLGSVNQLEHRKTISKNYNLVETLMLLITGLFFLVLSFINSKKGAPFYFAMLCITWAIRSVFSNNYLFATYYPDFSWVATVRIEYITLYFTMIWAILTIANLFQNETNLIIKYSLVMVNFVFVAFSIFTDPRNFTEGLNIYLIVSGLLLFYVGYIVIHAWVNERTGSGLLTLSIILGLIIFSYDIFVYEGFSTYEPVIFGIGYIFIFMLIAWALAMQLNLIKSKQTPTNSLTYEDLYKKED